MSYEKAMRHATNRNLKKGRNQYMGFDVSSKPRSRKEIIAELFPFRNGGWKFKESKEFMRKCLRMHINLIREGSTHV
ncbi:hypothetical protein KAR91_37405 [Candidatus Pacearchaeota archaeon]|nr:hypothetical protein [Candidatus Pacearchaeota archaeon]